MNYLGNNIFFFNNEYLKLAIKILLILISTVPLVIIDNIYWEAKLKKNPEWNKDPQGTRKEWKNDSKRFDKRSISEACK